VPSVGYDFLEAVGPIVTSTGEYSNGLIYNVHLDAVAVELNLMNPSLAGWHLAD
jgi:hypothetical protein